MWTIDSLWVSSYSSAWDSEPLAKAAAPAAKASPVPNTWQGPGPLRAAAASRTDRPNGVEPPAMARPMTSRTRNLVASTTSGGRSSNARAPTHRPSWREWLLCWLIGAL